jgi:LacI family transcriptional regulator, galactose operon repressor
MKKVTSFDVAKKAGVSRATVSYVLNNVKKENISDKTKEKVMDVVRELGYVPNAAGKALASNRTRNIGLICLESHMSHSFLLQIINGLTKIVRKHDLRLLIDTIPDGAGGHAILNLSQTKSIDGLVLFETREHDNELQTLLDEKFPVVIIGEYSNKKVCSVDVDVPASAQKAVEHLIELNHRKIGCITNSPLIYTAGTGRLNGYRKALENAGIEYDESIVRYGEFTAQSGFEAMNDLLKNKGNEFTAMFVASDTVAFGAMRAIDAAGLRIPEDIAVMGYDNVPIAKFSNPPLSTVHFSGIQMGMDAGEMLVELIDNKIKPGVRKLQEIKIMKRQSTIGLI